MAESLAWATTPVLENGLTGNNSLVISECPRSLWAWPFPDDKPRHITVTAPRRTIVVGDPHGCFDEFEELLKTCEFDADSGDAVVVVGDLVNKGPKSLEMIRAARDRVGIWSLRGNHEDNALRDWHAWKKEGKTPKDTWVMDLNDEDVQYLQDLPYTCTLPQHNALVVHAGLVPGKVLEDQLPGDMVRMRNLAMVAEQGEALRWVASERDGVGMAWASLWRGPPHVFFGHDAIRQLQDFDHATGLDTGCCYGFRMTACILDPTKPGERQLKHVDAHAQYVKPDVKPGS